MEFYWAGLLFWSLLFSGLLFFIVGLLKKSPLILSISGALFILPMLYFLGAEHEYRLLIFIPLIPFGLALFHRKTV
ncbi:hypothetical protein [Paucisalibacillus sp. EB02]|uniref:hypothetical protein n=1 Tax=Paucisalibacillus sp. EB02 TaxID=1347087 RepID=UPI0004B6991B|nr:hypothetical protein [Paucisalibacillus sp. EB02]